MIRRRSLWIEGEHQKVCRVCGTLLAANDDETLRRLIKLHEGEHAARRDDWSRSVGLLPPERAS